MCLLKQFEQFNHKENEDRLKAAGLWKNGNIVKLVNVLVSLIDRRQTVTIGGVKHKRGATSHVSQDKLASRVGVSRQMISQYVKQLTDADIIRTESAGTGGHNCLRYVFVAFDEGANRLRTEIQQQQSEDAKDEGSAPKTCKAQSLHLSETDSEKGVNQTEKGVKSDPKTCKAQSLHHPELTREIPDTSSHTSLAARASIASTVPTEVGGEGRTDVDLSDPEPTDTETVPKEEKTSLKGKDVAFFTSPSFLLADKFAGDELEHTPDELRKRRAHRFRDHLIKMFHAPRLAEECPDEAERLEKCVQVLAIWIEIVQARDTPAESVGFMNTEPGMRALTQARKQVFAAYADYQEVQIDPTLKALYEQRYGENWREKRAEAIARGGG